MLQSIRNQKRWLALLAMLLVIPAFVFIGINGYSRLNPNANAIALIDGKGIQPDEFDQAKRNFIEQSRQTQEGKFDPSAFDTPEVNAAILRQLITDRALQADLVNNYMNIGEADAIRVIKQAAMFHKDGKFSPELYENYLAARGKSDQQFVYELRRDLARQMLVNAVDQTSILPKKTIERLNSIFRQERVVRLLPFEAADYMKDVKVTDEQVKAYYDAHKDSFMSPEMVDIEYTVMSPKTIKVSAQPSEDELRQFYEQNASKYGQAETRRASHILIEPDSKESDPAKADAAARAKATELTEQAKKAPEKFSELAKENSADLGSATHGGDLDFFARGQMVPEFDQAVFSAKKGDILGPVKSQYGYHVIYVTDISPARTKSFEEVRPDILALWQNQQKQNAFAEHADEFTNMVYEQSDSLKPVAEKFGLTVHEAIGLMKNSQFIDGKQRPEVTRQVTAELFAPESLNEKRNTQAFEVDQNTLVSARVVRHMPQRIKSFDEVASEVRALLEHQQAFKLAREAGEKKLAALLKNSNTEGFQEPRRVSVINPDGVAPSIVLDDMKVPASSLPTYTGSSLDDNAYVISYIESSKSAPVGDELYKSIERQALAAQSEADERAYYDALNKLYELEYLKPEFDIKLPRALN